MAALLRLQKIELSHPAPVVPAPIARGRLGRDRRKEGSSPVMSRPAEWLLAARNGFRSHSQNIVCYPNRSVAMEGDAIWPDEQSDHFHEDNA